MTGVRERERRLLFRPVLRPAPRSPEPDPRRAWWRYVALLLLGGYLLFAHGCHGDEDNELFAGRWRMVDQARLTPLRETIPFHHCIPAPRR